MTDRQRYTIEPEGVHPPTGKYSHAVRVRGGELLVIAGQVPIDVNGHIVGVGDIASQTPIVFENITKVLESAGGSFADVVELTYYIVGRGNVATFIEARTSIFERLFPAGAHPPATLVVVDGLANEAFLVEISALAVLP